MRSCWLLMISFFALKSALDCICRTLSFDTPVSVAICSRVSVAGDSARDCILMSLASRLCSAASSGDR